MAMFLLAALLTAAPSPRAGSIGFVGLIVPHALPLRIGTDQRVLLPACGACRRRIPGARRHAGAQLVAPQQLPVGVVTALIGVPVFLSSCTSCAERHDAAPMRLITDTSASARWSQS